MTLARPQAARSGSRLAPNGVVAGGEGGAEASGTTIEEGTLSGPSGAAKAHIWSGAQFRAPMSAARTDYAVIY